MDAAQVVGIGNIYASESLFRAGIDPTLPVGELGPRRCARLATCIRETLTDALAAGGSTCATSSAATARRAIFSSSILSMDATASPAASAPHRSGNASWGSGPPFCARCQH
jgi:formamidopyrimidine-DNA glycosylase